MQLNKTVKAVVLPLQLTDADGVKKHKHIYFNKIGEQFATIKIIKWYFFLKNPIDVRCLSTVSPHFDFMSLKQDLPVSVQSSSKQAGKTN